MAHLNSRFLCFSTFVLFSTASLLGQSTGGSSSSSSSSGSRGGTTGSTTVGTTPSQRQTPQPTFQRPILIMGKVIMEDGSPVTQRIGIKRTCQNQSRHETYTDAHGTFSFQIGGSQPAPFSADASDSSVGTMPGPGPASANGDPLSAMFSGPTLGGNTSGGNSGMTLEQQIWSCDITADLAGYRSDRIMLAGRHVMDDPDIGTIVLHPVGKVSGSTISATSMRAPKSARKDFEKARDLLHKGKAPEAQAYAEKAVAAYPQYAEAWNLVGETHEVQKQLDEARTAYNKALEADSRFMPPYLSIARLAGIARNWPETDRMSAKVMEYDGVDFPEAFFLNAIANFNLQKFDVAEKSARRAEQLDTQHHMPRLQLLMATLLERKGDFAGAAGEYRVYLKAAPEAPDATDVQKQIAQLEKAISASAKPAAQPATQQATVPPQHP